MLTIASPEAIIRSMVHRKKVQIWAWLVETGLEGVNGADMGVGFGDMGDIWAPKVWPFCRSTAADTASWYSTTTIQQLPK
jgi:hypothetical protein